MGNGATSFAWSRMSKQIVTKSPRGPGVPTIRSVIESTRRRAGAERTATRTVLLGARQIRLKTRFSGSGSPSAAFRHAAYTSSTSSAVRHGIVALAGNRAALRYSTISHSRRPSRRRCAAVARQRTLLTPRSFRARRGCSPAGTPVSTGCVGWTSSHPRRGRNGWRDTPDPCVACPSARVGCGCTSRGPARLDGGHGVEAALRVGREV